MEEAIFKDPMTTAAAIGRLVHHSVILELNIPSYRMEQAKKKIRRKKHDRAIKKERAFLNWRLRLQTSGIYRVPAIPGCNVKVKTGGSAADAASRPGLAPEVSAQVASLRSLISAPVRTSVKEEFVLEKLVGSRTCIATVALSIASDALQESCTPSVC